MPDLNEQLRATGVSRDGGAPDRRTVLVFFNRTPTDDELRALHDQLSQHGSAAQAVAKVRSKFGDPEAFGEREIVALDEAAVQKLPYGTVLYAVPAGGNSR